MALEFIRKDREILFEVYREEKNLSLPYKLNKKVLHLQLLQRQPIIILSEKSSVNKFQIKDMIILVIVIFGTEVFITIARGVLLEEAGKVFQVFLLVSFEVAAHDDNAPVGVVTYATTIFPETDV